MPKESVSRPFYTVLFLALVCSILVSGAAVGLRHRQELNKQLDQKINILRAAGLYQKDISVDMAFKNIDTRIIELATGEFVEPDSIEALKNFDQRQAVKNSTLSTALIKSENIAGLSRLERYSYVYLLKEGGEISQVILPIRGKGLWSTMYAYVSLAPDLSTVRGISFYEHGETPGLGGEITNQRWLAGWNGKRIYNDVSQVVLRVIKGESAKSDPELKYKVDGISGATLTGKGVNNILKFWFGEHGFQPFLERFKISHRNTRKHTDGL